MKKRILAVLLATAMVASLAVGCGKSNDTTKTETKTENTKKGTGDGTFTMAIDYMPDSLKPNGAGTDSFTTMIRPLYSSLFYQTDSGMEYYLADKLDVSDDGLKYTVHLNDKATWSDGEPITADDIQFRIDYSMASSGRSSLATVNGQEVKLNKIDDKTVEFVLPMPYANFKNTLGDTVLLPGHAFNWDPSKVDDSGYFWNTDMATSGPYVVSEINDDSLVYTARNDYFGGKPNVKKIVLRTLGSGSSKQVAFENGELSYMRVTTADELEKYEKNDNYNVTSISEARLNYLQLNPGGTFANLPAEAREAIMIALNDQEIIDAAYGSDKLATRANSVLSPMSAAMIWVNILLGLACIVIGGQLAVNGATGTARMFGLSETLIGLTIVAMGTSLPELVTSIVAARKGQNDIAMGNVIGSNLFNIFLILGVSSVITPIPVQATSIVDCLFLIAISAVFYLPARKGKLGRVPGIAMVAMYAVYTVYLIMR